jgi:hypothetical protein
LVDKEGVTLILVAHNLREVMRLCKRVLLLNHGRLELDGEAADVCNAFYQYSRGKMNEVVKLDPFSTATSSGSAAVNVSALGLVGPDGVWTHQVEYLEPSRFQLHFHALTELSSVVVNLGFQTADLLYLATLSSYPQLQLARLQPGEHRIECTFDHLPLLPGVYSLRLEIAQGDPSHGVFAGDNLFDFQITEGREVPTLVEREGLIRVSGCWRAGRNSS